MYEGEGFERSCKHISVPEGTFQSRRWGEQEPPEPPPAPTPSLLHRVPCGLLTPRTSAPPLTSLWLTPTSTHFQSDTLSSLLWENAPDTFRQNPTLSVSWSTERLEGWLSLRVDL